jgi:hypothetical protein
VSGTSITCAVVFHNARRAPSPLVFSFPRGVGCQQCGQRGAFHTTTPHQAEGFPSHRSHFQAWSVSHLSPHVGFSFHLFGYVFPSRSSDRLLEFPAATSSWPSSYAGSPAPRGCMNRAYSHEPEFLSPLPPLCFFGTVRMYAAASSPARGARCQPPLLSRRAVCLTAPWFITPLLRHAISCHTAKYAHYRTVVRDIPACRTYILCYCLLLAPRPFPFCYFYLPFHPADSLDNAFAISTPLALTRVTSKQPRCTTTPSPQEQHITTGLVMRTGKDNTLTTHQHKHQMPTRFHELLYQLAASTAAATHVTGRVVTSLYRLILLLHRYRSAFSNSADAAALLNSCAHTSHSTQQFRHFAAP